MILFNIIKLTIAFFLVSGILVDHSHDHNGGSGCQGPTQPHQH